MLGQRTVFYEPEDIYRDVEQRLARAREQSKPVDYLAFVPDGEPTLDANLGREISLLKDLGVPVGVITNSSLLGIRDVRVDLCMADWVSLKVDAVQEDAWQRINRPHREIKLRRLLKGIQSFAETFTGELVTETMLVKGLNDSDDCVKKVTDFVRALEPSVAYLSVPLRPPAEAWSRIPDEAIVTRAYQLLADRLDRVECLTGHEGNDFVSTGDVERDLLNITAVHPMRTEAVDTFLSQAGSTWDIVDRLISRGALVKTTWEGHGFYLRRFTGTGGYRI